MLPTHLNSVGALCVFTLCVLGGEAGVIEHEHGLEDRRIGGAPGHARVADDLLEGYIRIGQRSLDDLLDVPQQRREARLACTHAFGKQEVRSCMAPVKGAASHEAHSPGIQP